MRKALRVFSGGFSALKRVLWIAAACGVALAGGSARAEEQKGAPAPPKSNPIVRSLTARDADIQDVLQLIAAQTGLNIVADENVRGRVTVTLHNIPLEEALKILLLANGMSFEKIRDNTYRVTKGDIARPPRIEVRPEGLFIEAQNSDIRELIQVLSQKTGRNIVPGAGVTGRISITLNKLPLEDALRLLALSNGLVVKKTGDAFVFDKETPGQVKPLPPPLGEKTDTVSLDVTDGDLQEILNYIAAQTGTDIVTFGALHEKITVKITKMPVEQAIQTILSGTKFAYRKVENVYLVGDPSLTGLINIETIRLRYTKAEDIQKILPKTLPSGTVEVDRDRNAVIITGSDDAIKRIRSLIEKVDSPIPQIAIEALVIEVNRDTSKDLGLELGVVEGKFSAQLPSTGQVSYKTVGALPSQFVATLTALITENKARILANPTVSTVSGQEANIDVVFTRYYRLFGTITSTTGTGTGTGTGPGTGTGGQQTGQIPYYVSPYYYPAQNLQTIEAGIKLKVKPWVGGTGEITMELSPEVSSVVGTGPEGLPEISRRVVTTSIRVKDGQTIIIGGLIQREEGRSVRRTPLLSDLPFIGQIFRSTTTKRQDKELIIYITPRLIASSPEAKTGPSDAAPPTNPKEKTSPEMKPNPSTEDQTQSRTR